MSADGDIIELDISRGLLSVDVEDEVLFSRVIPKAPPQSLTVGRALFAMQRKVVGDAESGGCTLFEATG